jgi:hypothetical protein
MTISGTVSLPCPDLPFHVTGVKTLAFRGKRLWRRRRPEPFRGARPGRFGTGSCRLSLRSAFAPLSTHDKTPAYAHLSLAHLRDCEENTEPEVEVPARRIVVEAIGRAAVPGEVAPTAAA